VRIADSQYGIGYLKLTCFQKTTARDLDTALWKLHREGMKSLVVDVRGNPGGLLVAAVEVVDRFVERGVIVSTRGRSTQEDFTYSAHEQGKWRMPLVVMIDQDSASAAEIFAGAIRDHHRGTTVGVRSFGKGSVQGIFPLDDSTAGVRLTTAKFYSPNGRPYSRVGVDPDITVRVTAKPIDGKLPAGDDATLTAALQTARTLSQTLQARNSQ
jgi:carboxyl-terminal processing protease